MVELLVSIALMSVMTAVLLQSFIVARRLNARVSTEQRIQSLGQTAMESMRAADLTFDGLKSAEKRGTSVTVGDLRYRVERDGEGFRLICNDVGNGRGPIVSFGTQYGVACEIDPSPYTERPRQNSRNGADTVASFNSRQIEDGSQELLVQLRVVIYKMEERLAEDGPEQLRFESARTVLAGGAS
ncbi:MAG: type II secretion system GspH family protein [Lachnospiraceae bacterium]|nr:type II secretion system GspH family protein [Lachnospiraceae bacterium]